MKPYNEQDVSKNEGKSEEGLEYSALTPDGKQVKAYKPTENFYWMNGLEEYLKHIDHHHLEEFLDIVDPTPQTVDALMKLDLAAGVDVEIKL